MIKLAITGIIGAIIGAAAALYFRPAPAAQTQTVTQYRVRTVEKIIKQNGKETIERVVDDNSIVATKSTISKTPQYMAGLSVKSAYNRLEPVYELQFSRRMFGPVFAGLSVNTNKELGIALSMEF